MSIQKYQNHHYHYLWNSVTHPYRHGDAPPHNWKPNSWNSPPHSEGQKLDQAKGKKKCQKSELLQFKAVANLQIQKQRALKMSKQLLDSGFWVRSSRVSGRVKPLYHLGPGRVGFRLGYFSISGRVIFKLGTISGSGSIESGLS